MSLNNALYFDELTLRNFLSYGNNDTVINLDQPGTTLIVGEDVDSGTGTSNGAGKSTILNAIVYALFDRPLSKDIKLDDMINNVNKKNMHVGLKFRKGSNRYEIIRQRKGKDGNTVKLFINDELKTLDSIDQTNKFIIEKVIGYSYDVFVRIVVFSANHEPFFSLPTSGGARTTQTDIIEELFSLTALTLKATKAKAEIKENEQRVEIIKVKLEQIDKERARHETHLESIKTRMSDWDTNHKVKLDKAQEIVDVWKDYDFTAEIGNLRMVNMLQTKIAKIDDAKKRAEDWITAQDKKLIVVMKDRNALKGIDFEAEIRMHGELDEASGMIDDLRVAARRARDWDAAHYEKQKALRTELEELSKIDFKAQFDHFANIEAIGHEVTDKQYKLQNIDKDRKKFRTTIEANNKEMADLSNAKCPYCKQDFHDAKTKLTELEVSTADAISEISRLDLQESNLKIDALKSELAERKSQLVVDSVVDLNRKSASFETLTTRIAEAKDETNPHTDALCKLLSIEDATQDLQLATNTAIQNLQVKLDTYTPSTPNARTATRMQSELASLDARFTELSNETNPYIANIIEVVGLDLPDGVIGDHIVAADNVITELRAELDYFAGCTNLKDLATATRGEQELATYRERLQELQLETNPFQSTIEELEAMVLDEADYDEINKLQKVIDHQKLLVKLLTKSDSFVRKALIDKNIPLLNDQLKIYLKQLGLPHKVEFTNTMSASITQMGRPLSYNNLSTGQKARVNLALSWAFRDVLQKMHSHVNFCLLDEVLDVGLCAYGISAAAKMLKAKAKADKLTMFIISHRDELNSTFDRNLKVIFQRGFSRIEEQ